MVQNFFSITLLLSIGSSSVCVDVDSVVITGDGGGGVVVDCGTWETGT